MMKNTKYLRLYLIDSLIEKKIKLKRKHIACTLDEKIKPRPTVAMIKKIRSFPKWGNLRAQNIRRKIGDVLWYFLPDKKL